MEGGSILTQQYIDKTRVGVFGKEYGGYLSTRLLTSMADDLFACGAALSPITDFKLYASAFSERYLGLHTVDNGAYGAYELAKVTVRESLSNKAKFLIIHATADEKIHFQHTAELITNLVKAKANYSLLIYPDENHYMKSQAMEQHLHKSIVNFFEECFRIQDKPPVVAIEEEEED